MSAEAGAAVSAYLRRQRDRLVSREPLVRRDRPGAVAAMRISSRRLRSVWRVMAEPGSPESTLIADSTWLNEHLGAVRHLDVTAERVLAHSAMVGPGARWAAHRLEHQRKSAIRELMFTLDDPRYGSFVAALDATVDGPLPEGVGSAFRGRIRTDWTPLLDQLAAASATPGTEARADALHEARKSVKQLRDTARSLVRAHPATLRPATRRLAALQNLLGEHQDSVVCRRTMEVWLTEQPDPPVRTALRELTEHERAAADVAEARLLALYGELGALRLDHWEG